MGDNSDEEESPAVSLDYVTMVGNVFRHFLSCSNEKYLTSYDYIQRINIYPISADCLQ